MVPGPISGLYDYQKDAMNNIRNGSILCGGVGSGKSRTALAYYFHHIGKGGEDWEGEYLPMTEQIDLYIITTARKRDTCEWESDMAPFLLTTDAESSIYEATVTVDSWNNIQKYKDVTGAFFIFDEQRVVGYGAWTKSFLKIARNNGWILLSATPGDTWMDYMPVFIANGFYKNKTDFIEQHVIYDRHCKNFPKIDKFCNTGRLIRLRDRILIDMDFHRETVRHNEKVPVSYDRIMYKQMMRDRFNFEKGLPIENAAELCYELRKITNKDPSRIEACWDIVLNKKKCIIFYNFDYELEMLRELFKDYPHAEWNGHAHQPIPEGPEWVYLVQYTAGNEGWNCVLTDTIIFFSQNYSYKVMEQASGRIDRLNTSYKDLYYYHLISKSPIDLGIRRALSQKKKFNESRFVTSYS